MKILPCKLLPLGADLTTSIQKPASKHDAIIVTRYFLKNAGSSELENVDEWFKDRNQIFDEFTLPSIQNQTFQPKAWYIFIESGFETFLPSSLSKASDGFIHIKSINSDVESYVGAITRIIEHHKNSNPNISTVSCTRVDNDDALCENFLLTMDVLSRGGNILNDCIVTLPIGIQRNIQSGEENIYVFTNNHFLTSFHLSDHKTQSHIHSFDHTFTFSESRAVEIVCTSHPMWVEIVHGHNLRNRFKSTLPKLRMESLNPAQIYGDSGKENGAKFREVRNYMAEIQVKSNAMKPSEYFDAYAQILQWKQVDSMLEIGIHKGGSLKFWRSFYSKNTRIYGIDINPDCLHIPDTGATEIRIGSQVDVTFIENIKHEWGPFDLIIDDGSHKDEHMSKSLELMFSSLKPGGVYIVEDMFTTYWSNWGGGLKREGSFIETSKNRIDLMFRDYMTEEKFAKHHNLSNLIPPHDTVSNEIDSIHFYKCGITVFIKRPKN